MRVYTHASCLRHDPGAGHPECPPRLEAVLSALRARWPDADWRDAPAATRDQLRRVHSGAMLASVLGEGGLDPTFVIGGQLLAAGANARLGSGD